MTRTTIRWHSSLPPTSDRYLLSCSATCPRLGGTTHPAAHVLHSLIYDTQNIPAVVTRYMEILLLLPARLLPSSSSHAKSHSPHIASASCCVCPPSPVAPVIHPSIGTTGSVHVYVICTSSRGPHPTNNKYVVPQTLCFISFTDS